MIITTIRLNELLALSFLTVLQFYRTGAVHTDGHLARRNILYVLYFTYPCIHIAHRYMVHNSLSQEMSCNILIINILKIGSDLFNILFAVAMEIFPNKNSQVCQTNVVISNVTYCFPSILQFYDTNVMSPNLATRLVPNVELLAKNAFIIVPFPLLRLSNL